MNVDLAVIDMLRHFLPSGSTHETVRVYRQLAGERERRPTAGELVRRGLNPRSVKADSWFDFVHDEGHLSDAEADALAAGRRWMRHLEVTSMTKSFKIVLLDVLLDHDALFDGMPQAELAERCHHALRRDPSLRDDVAGVQAFEAGASSSAWRAYWRKNPVAAWAGGKWFDRVDGRLTFRAPAVSGAARQALVELTRELVDARLATYRRRLAPRADGVTSFVCKLITNGRHAILKLPSDRSGLPEGETVVRLDDGAVWQFRFARIACNVARPAGSQRNQLPDLLYRWFGPTAGRRGTDMRVRFARSPEGWWVEPVGQEVIELAPRGQVVCYPTLRAAAGSVGSSQDGLEAELRELPYGGPNRFAVQVSGDSMDGGVRPIRDGDWVVLEWARGVGLEAVVGRVCLVAQGDPDVGAEYFLKRVVREGGVLRLRSDHPGMGGVPVTGETVVVGRLVGVVGR